MCCPGVCAWGPWRALSSAGPDLWSEQPRGSGRLGRSHWGGLGTVHARCGEQQQPPRGRVRAGALSREWPCCVVTWYVALSSLLTDSVSLLLARKQEIIKVTEQLIEAINNGDFEAYT